MIDLHTHSTFSDGSLSPAELIKQAVKIKLEALAITDHDAVSGLKELQKAAKNKKIEIMNGAEMSVYYPRTDMEIIALDIPNQSLNTFYEYQQKEIKQREELSHKRIELLQKNGINITFEEVAYDSDGNLRTQIRRPHFVDVLLKKNYIQNTQEAYTKIFAKGGICYLEHRPWSAEKMIHFIRDNGAKAILAHPVHTKHSGTKLFNLVAKLKKAGLCGIEVFHSSHPKELRENYLEIIKELKLISGGGSDFHGGTAHPENKLGTGRNNNLNIPYIVFEEIKNNTRPKAGYYRELKKYL